MPGRSAGPRTGPRFIGHGTIYLTRLNAYFIARGTHPHTHTRIVFQPRSVPSSFPLLDGFAHRPSAEIFKVFSHTSDAATPITRARIRVVVIVQNPSGRKACFSLVFLFL